MTHSPASSSLTPEQVREASAMGVLPEYDAILAFYGSCTAARSGVPLMNHIDEGIAILEKLKAPVATIRAFCIHPIVQNSEPFDVSWSSAFPLAEEYRDKANAYLCCPENDYIQTVQQLQSKVGEMSQECALMLLADKLQNGKDFRVHHAATHPRSKQLSQYFDLWLAFLHQYIELPKVSK